MTILLTLKAYIGFTRRLAKWRVMQVLPWIIAVGNILIALLVLYASVGK